MMTIMRTPISRANTCKSQVKIRDKLDKAECDLHDALFECDCDSVTV